MLRQRSRPYLFSNSLAPAIVAASIKVLEMVEEVADLRDRLWANARLFREKMTAAGFTLAGADHAIIPVMLGDAKLAAEYVSRLETRDLQPTVGFASRGSLLPTRVAEGLPVIALNVDKVDVEFFRIKPEALPTFLGQWGRNSSLYYYQSKETLDMAELVYSGRFDLNPARNTRETLLLPIAGLKPLQQPGVYLAVMRQAGTYNYSQPATLFTLSDIGLSVHRYHGRLDAFAQALEDRMGSAFPGAAESENDSNQPRQ
mgnify:CR=1 FL=1